MDILWGFSFHRKGQCYVEGVLASHRIWMICILRSVDVINSVAWNDDLKGTICMYVTCLLLCHYIVLKNWNWFRPPCRYLVLKETLQRLRKFVTVNVAQNMYKSFPHKVIHWQVTFRAFCFVYCCTFSLHCMLLSSTLSCEIQILSLEGFYPKRLFLFWYNQLWAPPNQPLIQQRLKVLFCWLPIQIMHTVIKIERGYEQLQVNFKIWPSKNFKASRCCTSILIYSVSSWTIFCFFVVQKFLWGTCMSSISNHKWYTWSLLGKFLFFKKVILISNNCGRRIMNSLDIKQVNITHNARSFPARMLL